MGHDVEDSPPPAEKPQNPYSWVPTRLESKPLGPEVRAGKPKSVVIVAGGEWPSDPKEDPEHGRQGHQPRLRCGGYGASHHYFPLENF